MNKVVIVNKIYLRKEALYESEVFPIYFSFGSKVYSKTLVCIEGDFDYIEVFYKGYRGFIPLEYLLDEDVFLQMEGSFPSKDELTKLTHNTTFGNEIYIREDIYPYLLGLLEVAKKENISLSIIKGYTDIRELSSIFAYEYEELFMQRLLLEKPCISVYHSATVLDMSSPEINNRISIAFYRTEAYKWLVNNASKYNFHISPLSHSNREINKWTPWRMYFGKDKVHEEKANINENPLMSSNLYTFEKSLVVNKQIAKNNKRIKYIFLHNSEHTARLTAKYGLSTYGGTLYEVENQDERNIEIDIDNKILTYDPNRIFTDKGLKENLISLNENMELKYIERALEKIVYIRRSFLKLLEMTKKDMFISLHTNNRFSSLSVNYFANDRQSFDINVNKLHNPKNFFYTIDKKAFLFFKEKDYNVVLQKEDVLCDDGSFSIIMSRLRMNFITIEVQEGFFVFQKEMLSLAVFHLLRK